MPLMHRSARKASGGFTLIELVMVIVIMGVIGGIVVVFMKNPIDAYFSGAQRAALTDVADTTMRRIARDLRRALPNSVRTSGTTCVEFIPTKTGGRYRSEGPGALTFGTSITSITSFNMLGDYANFAGASRPVDQTIAANDLVVVYNLGITGSDAYAGNNYGVVTSVGTVSGGETPINMGATTFSLPSASNRFHVVPSTEKMVSYVCSGNSLYRTASATLTASASCPANGAKIATNVDCAATSFTITDAGNALSRNALVSMRLTIGSDSSGAEKVTLQHEVHVDNTP